MIFNKIEMNNIMTHAVGEEDYQIALGVVDTMTEANNRTGSCSTCKYGVRVDGNINDVIECENTSSVTYWELTDYCSDYRKR